MITRDKEHTWVLAEHEDGSIRPVTYEVLAFAERVTGATGGELTVVVVGFPVRPVAEKIAVDTGCNVLGIQSQAASCYNAEAYRGLLRPLLRDRAPRFMFVPHSTMGWDLCPGLAVDWGASSVAAVCGCSTEQGLVLHRAVLNGKIIQEVRPHANSPAVVTVLPGVESPFRPRSDRPGTVEVHRIDPPPTRTRTVGRGETPGPSIKLQEADVIVAAGRGVGDPEHLACIRELAGLFQRGAVGASRPLCDQGHLPLSCQVGITGQSVSPKLYIACGISGAVQHTMGMRNAGLVISINTDPGALFCRQAHYCVNTDLQEFIPILISRIRQFQAGSRP
jgi:electron transfer flavoprotein alpha subunit